jgi:hypothetical protein
MAERRSGLVPYLFYDDAGPMADWYAKVFGFEELSRYTDATGRVTNAEIWVGDTELWMDGKWLCVLGANWLPARRVDWSLGRRPRRRIRADQGLWRHGRPTRGQALRSQNDRQRH